MLSVNRTSSTISFLLSVDKIEDLSVQEVLIELGDEKPIQYLPKVNKDSIRMGYEMVYFGQLKDKSNKRISNFLFVQIVITKLKKLMIYLMNLHLNV